MDKILYYGIRAVAIAFGMVLTVYSCFLSWEHFGTLLGPLASVGAAIFLVLAPHGRRYALALWGLGILAMAISAAVVTDRVTATDAARMQATMDANHPKVVAERALSDAKAELQAAANEAKAECLTGRGKRCRQLEILETAARQRVADARAKMASAGAQAPVDPARNIFGVWAEYYRVALPLALPLWLEAAAPVLVAFGFAPSGRNVASNVKSNAGSNVAEQREKQRGQQREKQRPTATPGRRKKATARRGRSYWLARLDRDRPDLARLVRAGELSATGAAVRAGWRKSPVRLVSGAA
jgi:hypothetical protein